MLLQTFFTLKTNQPPSGWWFLTSATKTYLLSKNEIEVYVVMNKNYQDYFEKSRVFSLTTW